jgi:hypothetical protein
MYHYLQKQLEFCINRNMGSSWLNIFDSNMKGSFTTMHHPYQVDFKLNHLYSTFFTHLTNVVNFYSLSGNSTHVLLLRFLKNLVVFGKSMIQLVPLTICSSIVLLLSHCWQPAGQIYEPFTNGLKMFSCISSIMAKTSSSCSLTTKKHLPIRTSLRSTALALRLGTVVLFFGKLSLHISPPQLWLVLTSLTYPILH